MSSQTSHEHPPGRAQHLPPELWTSIIDVLLSFPSLQHGNAGQLHDLRRLNRAVDARLKEVLWATLDWVYYSTAFQDESERKAKTFMRKMMILAENPHLIKHVRHVNIQGDLENAERQLAGSLSSLTSTRAAAVISHASNQGIVIPINLITLFLLNHSLLWVNLALLVGSCHHLESLSLDEQSKHISQIMRMVTTLPGKTPLRKLALRQPYALSSTHTFRDWQYMLPTLRELRLESAEIQLTRPLLPPLHLSSLHLVLKSLSDKHLVAELVNRSPKLRDLTIETEEHGHFDDNTGAPWLLELFTLFDGNTKRCIRHLGLTHYLKDGATNVPFPNPKRCIDLADWTTLETLEVSEFLLWGAFQCDDPLPATKILHTLPASLKSLIIHRDAEHDFHMQDLHTSAEEADGDRELSYMQAHDRVLGQLAESKDHNLDFIALSRESMIENAKNCATYEELEKREGPTELQWSFQAKGFACLKNGLRPTAKEQVLLNAVDTMSTLEKLVQAYPEFGPAVVEEH